MERLINEKPIVKPRRGRPPKTRERKLFENLYEKVLVGELQPCHVIQELGIVSSTYYEWEKEYKLKNSL